MAPPPLAVVRLPPCSGASRGAALSLRLPLTRPARDGRLEASGRRASRFASFEHACGASNKGLTEGEKVVGRTGDQAVAVAPAYRLRRRA